MKPDIVHETIALLLLLVIWIYFLFARIDRETVNSSQLDWTKETQENKVLLNSGISVACMHPYASSRNQSQPAQKQHF